MPPLDAKGKRPDIAPYGPDVLALLLACGAERPIPGVVVDFDVPDDDGGALSRPIVIGPLYACATQVAVRGAVMNAEIQLTIVRLSGTTETFVLKPARNPDQVDFTGLQPLKKGDKVTAQQRLGGGRWSSPSAVVTVRHYKDDYSKIPIPEIDPTLVYRCASQIAVRHIPGAKLTVIDSDNKRSRRPTSTGYSVASPQKSPFEIGDKFIAVASLCGEDSGESAPVEVVEAPVKIPDPALDPRAVFPGQDLVTMTNLTNGSTSTVEVVNVGGVGTFETPVSWESNYDVGKKLGRRLRKGEQLKVEQRLCDGKSEVTVPPAGLCRDLPAPRIRQPVVGEDFVVIEESQPGARIRVYDAGRRKLGDGAGTVVYLSRALTSADTLTVIQELVGCVGPKGYRTTVRTSEGGGDEDP